MLANAEERRGGRLLPLPPAPPQDIRLALREPKEFSVATWMLLGTGAGVVKGLKVLLLLGEVFSNPGTDGLLCIFERVEMEVRTGENSWVSWGLSSGILLLHSGLLGLSCAC